MTDSITFDLYKLNNNSNVTEASDGEKADEEKAAEKEKTSSVTVPIGQNEGNETSSATTSSAGQTEEAKTSSVTIPIGQSEDKETSSTPLSIEQSDKSETADVSEFMDKKTIENLKKRKTRLPNVRVTRADVENAKNFLLNNAKELGLTEDEINSISKEDRALFIALTIAYEKGQISKEKYISAIEEYANETIAEKIKEKFKDSKPLSDEDKKAIEREYRKFGHLRVFRDKKVSLHIFGKTPEETKKLREEYYCTSAKRAEKEQQKLLETIAEALPEKCNAEDVKEIFEAAKSYTTTYNSSLLKMCEKSGYSKDFLSKLNEITKQTYEKIQRNATTFLEKFWKSAKGQAIKSYTKILFSSYIEKKKECEEKEEVALEKQEEAEAAEKEAQKAQEEANKKKAATDAILSKYKAEDLSEDKQQRIIQRISPRAALQKQWADADLKKAQEVQYDAESAKRLANKFLEIAEKTLAFLQARISILMSPLGRI